MCQFLCEWTNVAPSGAQALGVHLFLLHGGNGHVPETLAAPWETPAARLSCLNRLRDAALTRPPAALNRQDPKAPMDKTVAAPAKASRREWIGLAVIALPCLLYSMDLTVLNLAIPELSADLEPTSTQLLWIVDIYGFLLAGALITMGTLGDRIGRRRLLLIGACAFGVASVLASLAPTAEFLIAARGVLGIAGATLAPSTLSLIRNMFHDQQQRTFAIGIWAASFSVGAAIGPLIGGVLLQHFWWGSVFLISVPLMVLLLAVGPSLLPEFRDPKAGRIDLISAGLSLVAVLGVIFGLKRLAADGSDWLSFASIALGVSLGVAFVWRQRRLSDPLMDLRLFRSGAFSGALITNVLVLFVSFGTFLFLAQYLQLVVGLAPLQAGLATLPTALGFIAGSLLAPMLVRRFPALYAVTGGPALAIIGFAVIAQVDGAEGLGILIGGSVVFALGSAAAITLTTDLIVGAAPPERAGVASAISETGAELGGAVGIAVLGSIGTAIYRGTMTEALPPGLAPVMAATALDTLGGAVGVAEQLPAALGEALRGSARAAFGEAFRLIATISAGVLLCTALLALSLLRRRAPAGHPAR
jgi:DHA2 family multidrug resistance protein-like MFS transporter